MKITHFLMSFMLMMITAASYGQYTWPADATPYAGVSLTEPSSAAYSEGCDLIFTTGDNGSGPIYWRTSSLSGSSYRYVTGLVDAEGLSILDKDETTDSNIQLVILDEGNGSTIPGKMHLWNFDDTSLSGSITITDPSATWTILNGSGTTTFPHEDNNSGQGPEGITFIPNDYLPVGLQSSYSVGGVFFLCHQARNGFLFIVDWDVLDTQNWSRVGAIAISGIATNGTPCSLDFDRVNNCLFLTTNGGSKLLYQITNYATSPTLTSYYIPTFGGQTYKPEGFAIADPEAMGGGCYCCGGCGEYVYWPTRGDPDNGIAAGTSWENVPEDWICPIDGSEKDQFSSCDCPRKVFIGWDDKSSTNFHVWYDFWIP